jgi:nicotinamidase-related amidase
MSVKRALISIDIQNDFHDITGASLPVTGASIDSVKIAEIVEKLNPTTIFASMDSHYRLDISHPAWWVRADGSNVSPFTLITSDSIKNGEYNAVMDPTGSLKYVEELEKNGEFVHFIWPEHCIIGTGGHNLFPVFADALDKWSIRNKKWVSFINKGVNPFTEHFGIFRANVPIANDPSSQINQGVFVTLNDHDEILITGEARTHCVANSLRQMLQIAPNLAPKIIVLEDCMSDVGGLPSDFYAAVDKIYADAYAMGVKKARSTDF